MKIQTLLISRSGIRVFPLLLLVAILSGSHHAVGQQACPPLPGGELPPAELSVTAQQVEQRSASLRDFALAARAGYSVLAKQIPTLEGVARFGCLIRQDASSASGSTYIVALTLDGRVFVHAKDMSLSGRQINSFVYGAILSGLGVSPGDQIGLASSDPVVVARAAASISRTLSQQPDGPFDATAAVPGLRPGIPGASGYAAVYSSGNLGVPLLLVAGFDLNESHVAREAIDFGDPAITAKDVVDRETLKAFVTEALKFTVDLVASGDPHALSKARIALRDPNGPWRHGSVYLYVFDRNSNVVLLGGAFPDSYELRPLVPRSRDGVTGEPILPQILEAAAKSAEGGFVEYYFDDPSDDTERADIPKVGYAREFIDGVQTPDGNSLHLDLVVGSGFYRNSSAGGPAMTSRCSDHNIAASAVRTRSDIRAFVTCAAEYLAGHGVAEASRAFNEDARWKHGPTYVFGLTNSGDDTDLLVFPPDPSRTGPIRRDPIEVFGTDLFREIRRLTEAVDSGWVYYTHTSPETGKRTAKASYLVEVDWGGRPAVIGSGAYSRDLPGTCYSDEVSVTVLAAVPSAGTLREFVRCAAMVVEADGYFAKEEIERDPRWTDGEHYIYVLDMLGNQVMSGQRVRVNGKVPHEWGRGDQFGGRDMAGVGETFGESYVYYRSYDPTTGAYQPKVGFLKRVVAQGVPLLVGAGYAVGPAADGPSCADNYVTAAAVRTQSDLQAFVQCAAEYVHEHGEEEARRAFNEDTRWKSGPTYVFVDGVEPSGETVLAHVFPPDPSREGSVWGTSIDSFGSGYSYELHRILSVVDEGWIYYAFTNPATGRSQPKSSYVKEIEWNGERAAIGAGIYARDFPGACDPAEVNAAQLLATPSDQTLREFVRCAAQEVESAGYFAGPVLSSDPRWRQGPIYIVGLNAETGTVEFSGNRARLSASGRISQLLFEGRDAITVGAVHGESFWYTSVYNPATRGLQPLVLFFKLVRAQGVPLLIGSGYSP